jgi:hypothetical protein
MTINVLLVFQGLCVAAWVVTAVTLFKAIEDCSTVGVRILIIGMGVIPLSLHIALLMALERRGFAAVPLVPLGAYFFWLLFIYDENADRMHAQRFIEQLKEQIRSSAR